MMLGVDVVDERDRADVAADSLYLGGTPPNGCPSMGGDAGGAISSWAPPSWTDSHSSMLPGPPAEVAALVAALDGESGEQLLQHFQQLSGERWVHQGHWPPAWQHLPSCRWRSTHTAHPHSPALLAPAHAPHTPGSACSVTLQARAEDAAGADCGAVRNPGAWHGPAPPGDDVQQADCAGQAHRHA